MPKPTPKPAAPSKTISVVAAPGVQLPIPRSLNIGSGFFSPDRPTKVKVDRFIRRRLVEGSLIEFKPVAASPTKKSKNPAS